MSEESGKDCLPNGWIVRTSSKFPDRIYYFNMITGNSTWECPKLVPRSKEISVSKSSSGGQQTNNIKSRSPNKLKAEHSSRIKPPASFLTTPHPNVHKNTSQKRPLEIDPMTSHTPELFSFQKPPVGIRKQTKERIDNASTSRANIPKTLRIPTAIVTPVIAGEEKTFTCVSSSSETLKKKRNRRRKISPQKAKSVHAVVALPRSIPNTQQTTQNVNVKRLKTSPNSAEGLVAASTPYEAGSTDSDMELEFGSSLRSTPSTSREVAAFERRLSNNSSGGEVEMLDVSVDLTSLDEILPESNPSQLHSYYVVVDTNVLIHDINHLEEIKETPLQGCGPPHIIIPWVVIQELDRLKSYNDAPGKLAQKAVRYLHNILKSKHPRFHGQSGEEAHKLKREYHDSNDDKIIDLCLSLRKKMNPEKVILLTNDKNLANKAMIYELNVHDWTSLLKDIKPDIIIQAAPLKKKKQKKKANNESPPALMSKEHQRLVVERSGYEEEINILMTEARQILKNALDPFLVEEMQKTYGPSWERFQIDRRLLREILGAYIKFWPTVFYSHFSPKVKNSFELLHKKAISPEGLNGTSEECLMIIFHAIEDIFRALVKVQPNVSFLIGNIQTIQENYSYIFSKCNMVDSSICDVQNAIKESEANVVLGVLNHNWTVLNEICGMVCDFYGIRHTFQYPKPEKLPDESEYRRVVADLYPSILQLQQQMKKMIEHVINSTPSQPTFKRFVNSLKQLIPSLNIQSVMPDNCCHLTFKLMEQFCRNPENRQKIDIGYQQLENFCNKLSEAIQAMIAFKKNRPSTSVGVAED